MLGRFLFEYLTTDPDVTAIVGSRVFPLMVPQNSPTPAIAYFVQDQHLINAKGCYPHIFRASVLFNLWADVNQGQLAYDLLDELQLALIKRLHGMSETTIEKIVVHSCRLNMCTDMRDDTFLSFAKTAQFIFEYQILQ